MQPVSAPGVSPIMGETAPLPAPVAAAPSARDTQIERTKTGLLFLLVAVLLQWIPVIEYLGLLLGAVGAILMILGRRAFGHRHESFVWASVGLFVLTYLGVIALAFSFASSVVALGGSTGSSAAAAFLGAWDGLMVGTLVAVSLISACFALIAFDLEDLPGRGLLVAGVVVQTVISVTLLVVVFDPILRQAVTQAFASSPVDVSVIQAADAQVNGLTGLKVLNLIPALLFAGGYAWALDRIRRGAMPPSPKPPAPPSRPLMVLLVALVVLAPVAGIAAVATGTLPVTPPPLPAWRIAAMFAGTGTETTLAFAVNSTQSRFNSTVTSNASDFSFAFTIYTVGQSESQGGCGGNAAVSSCSVLSRPGVYYLVITDATGVASWTITVWQYA